MNKSLIARLPCGCVVGAMSETMGTRALEKQTWDWIRKGLVVELVSDDYVRQHFTTRDKCPHKEPEPVQTSLPGME